MKKKNKNVNILNTFNKKSFFGLNENIDPVLQAVARFVIKSIINPF